MRLFLATFIASMIGFLSIGCDDSATHDVPQAAAGSESNAASATERNDRGTIATVVVVPVVTIGKDGAPSEPTPAPEKKTVRKSEEFAVEGQLRLLDKEAFSGVTAKLVQRDPDGREVIVDSLAVAPEERSNGVYDYRAKLKSPKESGECLLRIMFGKPLIWEQPLQVK